MIALAVLASAVATFVYALIAPLYPLQAASRLSDPLIGQVIAAYSVANLGFVPIAGALSRRCSDITLLTIGLFIEALALLVVAGLPLMQPMAFLLASFLFRCLQGAADTFIGNAALSIVQKSSKSSVLARNIALLEALRSVGSAFGPLADMVIFPIAGFKIMFVAAGALVALVGATTFFLTRRQYKKTSTLQEALLDNASTQDSSAHVVNILEISQPEVTVRDLLGIRGVLFAAIQSTLIMAVWNYREPILPQHFKDMGLSQPQMATYFLISPLASAICGFCPMALATRFKPRTLIIFGNIIQAGALALIGPSSIAGMSPSISLTAIGLGLCGATYSFSFAPILAEMQQQASYFRFAPNFANQLALINLLARPLGLWAGPMLASVITSSYGFGTTADVFMLVFVTFTVIYIALGTKRPMASKSVIYDS